MKSRTIYLLSSSIGGTFIIILIILKFANVIKLSGLIIFASLIVIAAIIVSFLFSFKGNKEETTSHVSVKSALTKLELADIHQKLLAEPRYAEYEDEVYWCDILEMGRSNTPIYFRMCRGKFDRLIYGTVLNILNPELGGIEEYDDSKMPKESIKSHMLSRGNGASFLPLPRTEFEVEEVINELTGGKIIRTKPIYQKDDGKKEEKEVKLE